MGFGGYPLECTKIKIWNFEINTLEEQNFYHRNSPTHFDCFLIPKYLEYIHGKISMDGTFKGFHSSICLMSSYMTQLMPQKPTFNGNEIEKMRLEIAIKS